MTIASVPHHHHEGTACMVMKHAHEDNVPKSNEGQSCIAEADYFNFNTHTHEFLFPLYYYVADIISRPSQSTFIEYGEYLYFYKSAETNQFNGLRAPPYQL